MASEMKNFICIVISSQGYDYFISLCYGRRTLKSNTYYHTFGGALTAARALSKLTGLRIYAMKKRGVGYTLVK